MYFHVMTDPIRIPNVVIPSLSSLALKQGLNPEKVFIEAGVDLAAVQLHELDLGLHQVEGVMDVIIQQANLPQLGLVLGEHVQAEMLGVFGPLIASSPTTRIAIDCFSRFKQLLHPMFDMRLEEKDGESIIVYTSMDDTPIGDRPIYAEALFSALMNLGSIFIGKSMQPSRIEFRHAQTTYLDEYQRIFGCPIFFDCEQDRMIGDAAVLDLPMLSQSFGMHQLLKTQAGAKLQKQGSGMTLAKQVSALIKRQLGKQAISATSIAEQLNMSARTLQRQLNKEQTSFKLLREAQMLEVAKQLLSTTQLSTETIAFELGYQDRSNFVHAFTRLAGCSPSEFRVSENHTG